MTLTHMNPDTIFKPRLDAYTMVITATGTKQIHLAGVTGKDKDRQYVGDGGMLSQIEVAMDNIQKMLTAAGATVEDVVHMNIYITDMAEYRRVVKLTERDVLHDCFPPGKRPAGVAVGVTSLVDPSAMIEIEATAIVD